MKLSSNQTDVESLTQFGREAIALVERRDFSSLAKQFGYALSFERNLVQAIESDFARCISRADSPSSCTEQSINVKYFKPNTTQLYALVECFVPVSQVATVLIELIVTGQGEDKDITLEDISYVS